MATTTILRETENLAVVQITGAGVETNAVVLNPSGGAGATGFANGSGGGIVSVERIEWVTSSNTVGGPNKISLNFNGSTDQLIGNFAGVGSIDYQKDFQTKITNVAPSNDSTILLTTTTADPYTLVVKLEKTSGFTKVGQYS